MNNIIQTIRHTARAATVLLLALLAAQTAGAQEDVSNAAGLAAAFDDTTVSVVNVTDDITGVGACSLNHSLTINGGGQDGSVGNIISGNAY